MTNNFTDMIFEDNFYFDPRVLQYVLFRVSKF